MGLPSVWWSFGWLIVLYSCTTLWACSPNDVTRWLPAGHRPHRRMFDDGATLRAGLASQARPSGVVRLAPPGYRLSVIAIVGASGLDPRLSMMASNSSVVVSTPPAHATSTSPTLTPPSVAALPPKK